jgi:hypothetical protein
MKNVFCRSNPRAALLRISVGTPVPLGHNYYSRPSPSGHPFLIGMKHWAGYHGDTKVLRENQHL